MIYLNYPQRHGPMAGLKDRGTKVVKYRQYVTNPLVTGTSHAPP